MGALRPHPIQLSTPYWPVQPQMSRGPMHAPGRLDNLINPYQFAPNSIHAQALRSTHSSNPKWAPYDSVSKSVGLRVAYNLSPFV